MRSFIILCSQAPSLIGKICNQCFIFSLSDLPVGVSIVNKIDDLKSVKNDGESPWSRVVDKWCSKNSSIDRRFRSHESKT